MTQDNSIVPSAIDKTIRTPDMLGWLYREKGV